MGSNQLDQQNKDSSTDYGNLAAIQRHLERLDERLDERTRNLATRQDLEALRKEMVTRDLLESHLNLFKAQIARLEADRQNDRKEIDERFDALKIEQTSRSERLWMRLSPIIAAIALLITLIEFLAHVRFAP